MISEGIYFSYLSGTFREGYNTNVEIPKLSEVLSSISVYTVQEVVEKSSEFINKFMK